MTNNPEDFKPVPLEVVEQFLNQLLFVLEENEIKLPLKPR